ncbi:MAG TPA: 4-hydroxy-tetrahydrodipicolinate reductase [Bacteroidales bacterium]|nr:4-hydroxy-tetrahydrodipicolinate reductase [Bacteroidales bacterium]HRZ49341.1 4-hydroxy-tetrahydrodipicolinate reductase [Bacteroidales bacterium]
MKNLAIIGYGKMGRKIEELASGFGFQVQVVVDNEDDWLTKGSLLKTCDAAVEFTFPAVAPGNLIRLSDMGIPTVCGTTGWEKERNWVEEEVKAHGSALLVSSNFSIGMNLFFSLNAFLARLMNSHPEYKPALSETHHIHKLDAPSGTAKTLAASMLKELPEYQGWITAGTGKDEKMIPVTSVREGEVAGIHSIVYNGPSDQIEIRHEAFNRNGLAEGALTAARWIAGRKGIFTMEDVLYSPHC